MFFSPVVEKFVRTFIALSLVSAGIYTFGNAQLFDRLYILIILTVGFFVRKDINMVGIIALLGAQRLVEEAGYVFIHSQFIPIKVLIYLCCTVGLYKIRFDPFRYPLGTILAISISAEFYWYYTDYKAPVVWWHVLLITNSMLVRKLIWMRELWTKRHFPGKAQSLDMDYYIYELCKVYIWVNIAMVLEYMVRHILLKKQILYVYSSFPYVVHSITVVTLLLLVDQSIKSINAKMIKV